MLRILHTIVPLLAIVSSFCGSVLAQQDFYPPAEFDEAHRNNFRADSRGSSDVNWIIIHTTEGSCQSAINTFNSPASQVSAHYVICRDGSIIQMVKNSDVAFTAGNSAYNRRGFNIEIERYNGAGADPTAAQYSACATLCEWLADQFSLSLTIQSTGVAPANAATGGGIIGHRNIPDPNNPALGGGVSHHSDPVNWNWTAFANELAGGTPPAPTGLNEPFAEIGQVGLDWNSMDDAANYRVQVKKPGEDWPEQSSSPPSSSVPVNIFISPNPSSYIWEVVDGASVFESPIPNQTYVWRVRQWNGFVHSDWSAERTFTVPGQAEIEYASSVVRDGSGGGVGNSDATINPGEEIDLKVALQNSGTAIATNVSAILSSTSPYIEIVDSSENWPDIDAGRSEQCNADFDFNVSPSAPGREVISFDLVVNSSSGEEWNLRFELTVFTPPKIIGVSRITLASPGQQDVTIVFDTNLGKSYDCYSSEDLKQWELVQSAIAGTGSEVSVTDSDAMVSRERLYYRFIENP